MDDKRTMENISEQVQSIERNNFSNMSSLNSMEMLLTSNNNGTSKDRVMSQRLNVLKHKTQEAVDAFNEFKSTLGKR